MSDAAPHPVEVWEIDKVIPFDKNAKKHPPEQVEKLAKAIKKFGWTQPIVVDVDGVIIAGHGRRLAAQKLKMKKVPVICRRDLDKDAADALRLADNRVASTEYDSKLIQAEIARLFENDFEIDAIGFDSPELDFLMPNSGVADMDDAVFVDDITEAVETQKSENKVKAAEIDVAAAPIADALGFKRVTVAQSRQIRAFMAKIEARTGQKGVDALLAHAETV
jgi:ParB-like chromosome segregation protein Spo0J